jgi:hypothetical protein
MYDKIARPPSSMTRSLFAFPPLDADDFFPFIGPCRHRIMNASERLIIMQFSGFFCALMFTAEAVHFHKKISFRVASYSCGAMTQDRSINSV